MISIIIPNSVTSIGERAFFGCKSLTTIIALNPTPISISYNTFNYRANETLYVPDGRKSVYEAANIWKEFKEIKEITLNHSTTEIQIGEKLQLDATVLSEASGSSITWSSSDETIASVSVDGLVTANKLGTVTITATANNGSGIKEEWTITVKHVLIKEITLNEDSLELRLDRTYNLTANIIPENATFKEIIWSSSDESVAMVRDGKVTALKKGTAWITVTTTDGSNL